MTGSTSPSNCYSAGSPRTWRKETAEGLVLRLGETYKILRTQASATMGVGIGVHDEGSPLHPVRGPGGPRDRGSPRSASGSRPGPDCGARGRRQPERLEEAQGSDGSGAPADHGLRGGGRRRRARRGRCGRGRRRSRVRFVRRGAAQAELAVLSYYAPIPPSLDFAGAAALPAAAETAWRSLDQLGVGSGSTLLINGASGSVGSAAVQLAVVRGARVIGTASPANHEYLRSLGAGAVG